MEEAVSKNKMKTGLAQLPLHGGSCPKWLFSRMKALGGLVSEAIIEEYGPDAFLKRLSNPFFFQALGCAIGFDWHSSGLTTTVCGALKEALNERKLGIRVAGGKGSASRKAPEEIEKFSEKLNLSAQKLVRASKLSAKVDNSLVQDSYNLYHHIFIIAESGKWAVVQQGMNPAKSLARRYHWLSSFVKDFVEEPHSAICCQQREARVLDMTSKKSKEAKKISVDLVNDFDEIKKFAKRKPDLKLPARHNIKDELRLNYATLKRASEIQPKNYEELILVKGFGPKHIRALALISELIYGSEPSWQDPANFSFALGGKDGHPYPVNKRIYDDTILTLKEALECAKLGRREKLAALKRLSPLEASTS